MKPFDSRFNSGRRQETMPPHCLRCRTAELTLISSTKGVAFFGCSKCHREFTRGANGKLCFRWGHPITLLLYYVIFEDRPLEQCERVASEFVKGQSWEVIEHAIQEIRLELNDPTQQVRDTLQCCASEENLRAYLKCVADRMEVIIRQI